MQGSHIPPQAAARMKQMGMSKVTMIIRGDKGFSYMVYPDMKAYTEMTGREKYKAASEYKADVTKLGEETVDGHDCVKNKVVVTDPTGPTRESTVWNATDLKKFPVKIQMTSEKGNVTVVLFKDVKLEKPDDAQFDPPSDFKKYDDMMSLMMSRARGAPPQ
jgi:outer membrane lipoprotein-sorting protein